MHKNSLRNLFKSLSLPIAIILFLLLFSYLGKFLAIPSSEDLINIVLSEFGELNLWAVFFIALIEGFLFLGQYFPGGIIVFFSIISAQGDLVRISALVLVISVSFVIAYSLNYFVGRYGLYKIFNKIGFGNAIKSSQKKILKKASTAIAISYEDPNLASITATASGIVRLPFKKFLILSIIWALFWNIFWAIAIYFLGEATLKLIGVNYIYFIALVWMALIIFRFFISKHKEKHNL